MVLSLALALAGCSSTPKDDDPRTASFWTVATDLERLKGAQQKLDAEVASAKVRYEGAVRQADQQRGEMETLIKEIDQQAAAAGQDKGVDPAKLEELRRLEGEAKAAKADLDRAEAELREARGTLQRLQSLTPQQQQDALQQFKQKEAQLEKARKSNESLRQALQEHLKSLLDERRRREQLQ
jgi:chromosome segregation ATPase